MEEKKFDLNSIIGFILIFGILVYMMYANQPTPEELAEQEKAKQEQVQAENKVVDQENVVVTKQEDYSSEAVKDSAAMADLNNKLGAFAYASTLPSAQNKETLVETDVLAIKFSNKGGYVSEVRLKQFVDYDSIPIYIIKDGNAKFNINFATTDNRILNSNDLYFEPSVSKSGDNTIVSMKLKVSSENYLEYRYELKPDDYMMDFTIRSQGLNNIINSSQEVNLDWELKAIRHAKSIFLRK